MNEEWSDLDKLTTKASLAPNLGFSAAEIEDLRTRRQDLLFHERARLLRNLVLTAGGTAWLDPGNTLDAEIEIDDSSSPERATSPYAHIRLSDGHQETIDIIESVKTNPTLIGHPVIVFAIHHWQRVACATSVFARMDSLTVGDRTKGRSRREASVAAHNLKALSRAFTLGVKKSVFSKEVALALSIKSLDLNNQQGLLYKAWEGLKENHPAQRALQEHGIDIDEDGAKRLAKIDAHLMAVDWEKQASSSPIDAPKEIEGLDFETRREMLTEEEAAALHDAIVHDNESDEKSLRDAESDDESKPLPEWVRLFLQADDNKNERVSTKDVMGFLRTSGSAFVGCDAEGRSLRPQWRVFRNAFIGWLFDLSQSSTVQPYLETSSKVTFEGAGIYQPTGTTAKSSIPAIVRFLMATSLVRVITDEDAAKGTNEH